MSSRMSYSAEEAALHVQERLKQLSGLVHDIENERVKGERNLNLINKAPEKMTQDGKLTPYTQSQLKLLYLNAINDATQEEELLRQALKKINEIRTICNQRRLQTRIGSSEIHHRGVVMKMVQLSAPTLPLWVGKPGTKPPPLCGAIPPDPSYIAKPGDLVAALVESVGDWMLAEVVSYNPVTKKYEVRAGLMFKFLQPYSNFVSSMTIVRVDDIDEEQKPRHAVSRRKVVPLPLMRANPETDPEALFPVGTVVMALYPQTTCFYKGIVNRLPQTTSDDYEIIFEDALFPKGLAPPVGVTQRYVIEIKGNKKA